MATKRATKEEDSTGEKSTTGDETETKVKGEPCSYFGIVLLFLIHLSYTYLIDTATPKPKGWNWSAIFIMGMMGLPAIITLSITAWDYFYPKEAVLRVLIHSTLIHILLIFVG